jgi:hypothetical protein
MSVLMHSFHKDIGCMTASLCKSYSIYHWIRALPIHCAALYCVTDFCVALHNHMLYTVLYLYCITVLYLYCVTVLYLYCITVLHNDAAVYFIDPSTTCSKMCIVTKHFFYMTAGLRRSHNSAGSQVNHAQIYRSASN